MKKALVAVGILSAFVLLPAAWGEEKPNHVSMGVGYYFYTGDIDDRTNLDGAFNSEIAYTRSLHQNFALRGSVGYFHDGRRGDDLRGYPLTLTALGTYPRGPVRWFAGVGLGLYLVDFEGRIDAVPVTDKDTVLGGHLLIGVSVDVWSSLFIGLEGKYLILEKASLRDRELDLDGFALTTTLGFRF